MLLRCIYEGKEYDFVYRVDHNHKKGIIILDLVFGWKISGSEMLKPHPLYELIKHMNGWYVENERVQIISTKKFKRKRLLWNQDTKEKGLTKKNSNGL